MILYKTNIKHLMGLENIFHMCIKLRECVSSNTLTEFEINDDSKGES